MKTFLRSDLLVITRKGFLYVNKWENTYLYVIQK
jgi:hypothetical protein